MRYQTILVSLLAVGTGCGGNERLVTGTLDLAALGRSEARLVAARTNEQIEAVVNADGHFSVSLPAGRWAIAYADSAANGGRIFANLVVGSGDGRRGELELESDDALELGRVRPETGDDHGGDRDDCREIDSSGDISLFANFLVRGENAVEDNPDRQNELEDRDGDGRPDVVDEDSDDDEICDDHHQNRGGDDDDSDDADAGVPDADDDGGEDAGDDHGGDRQRSDLPYDVRLEIGDTFALSDAFAEKGAQPAEILSVEMEGGAWRLAELQSLAPFTVEAADCTHEGNRDEGRDRIFVSWRNTDGSLDVDHLDLRYCD